MSGVRNTEGWGGPLPKAHYIRGDQPICGRVWGTKWKVDRYYDGRANHPDFCWYCVKALRGPEREGGE